MRVQLIEKEPFDTIRYLNAGRKRVQEATLPLLRGTVSRLPDPLDALVVAADLQGRALASDGSSQRPLLGEVLAEHLAVLAERGEFPSLERVGVLLGGDLYTVPELDRRGGLGDVRPVWNAFACRFRWVAGVAGNHDGFGSNPRDVELFLAHPQVHLFDGDVRTIDSVRIGGVGGIIGKPTKPNRKNPDHFLGLLEQVIQKGSEIVVLHESPSIPGRRCRGRPEIRETIEAVAREAPAARGFPIVVCGHVRWPEPLVELEAGVQFLNVDARVVVLTRPSSWL